MDTSAFATEVERVRAGGSVDVSARRLVDQLGSAERLWLLDGDRSFWSGVLEFARHGYNKIPLVAGAIPRLGVPGLRFTDGPRGVTLGRSTCFPVAIARGATWDPDLEHAVGLAIGREARAQGANLFGGVCVNVLRHPAWGRAQETYGEDPIHLGVMGAALTRGVQRNAMACVKHFALNSIENARFQVDVIVDADVLDEVYLPQFRHILAAGARVVMSAYNAVNGEWCGDSATLLTAILRDDWQFTGIVISDFVWGHRDPIGSVGAGLDVEMPFRQQRAAALPAAGARGELSGSTIERVALRIIATQLRHAAAIDTATPARSVVACAAHRVLARTVATRAMVLLRNVPVAGTPVLPLDRTTTRSAAVFGRLATRANLGDNGSSNLQPPTTVSPLAGLSEVLPTAFDDGTDLSRAAELAARSDVAIVVVGYRAVDEGEFLFAVDDRALTLMPWPLSTRLAARGLQALFARFERDGRAYGGDRKHLGLRAADDALIATVTAANPRTIVVVIAGSAVVMESWRAAVPAIVLAWYPGMEGGRALADVLTGAAEPGGRLPFVIPTTAAHLPHFDRDARTIRYDRWYGYRKLDRDAHAPAFAFGFGLGYTTWRLRALVVRYERAEVSVTNTGTRAGATIVQLYAIANERDHDRPTRQLVGFARIELAAGATSVVEIAWSLAPLSRRDSTTWNVVPGVYRFEAGQHLGDPDAAIAHFELS